MNSLSNWIADYTDSKTTAPFPGWAEAPDGTVLREFFEQLASHPPTTTGQQEMVQLAQVIILQQAVSGQLSTESFPVDELARAYRMLPEHTALGAQMLQLLALLGTEAALRTLADLLVEVPPANAAYVAQICSPLLQDARRRLLPRLFPRLLDGLAHLSTAAAVLDLSNFTVRSGLLRTHPATERKDRLADMLGQLVQELELIHERPQEADARHPDLAHTVNESVSLAVSLCDALALIGAEEHSGKLFRAMELPHRRIRTEAAYALARLGAAAGEEALLAMAQEPVARLRVLAYAEELGILEKVSEQQRTDVAQAESALALWLADPAQLGLPPTKCELFHRRRLYWPGYDEPMDCFLFRFAYELGKAEYANIGIAGPLVHSLAADLQDLPPDDIYAVYAGWHAEHPEITCNEVSQLNAAGLSEVATWQRELEDSGYEDVQPQLLGSFFEQRIMVALATRDGVPGIAIIDPEHIAWRTRGNPQRPLGPTEAFLMHTGKKLLAAFNDE